MTGRDPLPARLLAYFPRVAWAAAILELLSAHGPRDLDARTLKLARLVASVTAGCPFCIDMNAAGHERACILRTELDAILASEFPDVLDERDHLAIELALSMSRTPVEIDDAMRARVLLVFTAREFVVLVTAIAQVNYWARLNQAFGVPAAGFFFESSQVVNPNHTPRLERS